MSFRKEKPQADFTIVCNAILRDARLSLRAKGLYALMVSKPEGWVFHEKAMLKKFTEGRDALRGAFKELLQTAWLSKVQPREKGKFDSNVYRIHSTVDWKTVDGKSATSNTDRSKTDQPTSCAFEKFWEAYPKKVGLKPCQQKWRSLKLDRFFHAVMVGLERWKSSDRWKRGYVLDPLTFLNQERWKDEPPAAIVPSKPGELKLRDVTDAEREDARWRDEIMRQRKMPENWKATDDQIAEKARNALLGDSNRARARLNGN